MEVIKLSIKGINTGDLAKKIINEEDLFILDVRNEDDFKDWQIEGKNIETLNKPYFDLLDGVDEIIDSLPRDKQILVVCAKEGSSIFVGEKLLEAGFKDVAYLKGGMKAWSDHLEPVKVGDLQNGGAIYQFVRLGKGCLSYIVASGDEAIIIDPVRTIDPFITFTKDKGLKISNVIDTHLHADHISGARTIREATGATYWLPKEDASEVQFDYKKLSSNSKIEFENSDVSIEVIYTPGHTIGSMSIIIDQAYLITGDILFVDSIGRPDLAGKADNWAHDLRETLYERYRNMSDNLIVLPAHFGKISELNQDGSVYEKLGTLFETNDGLQITDKEKFIQTVSENLPPQPNSYQEIRKTNMGKINPDQEEQINMEIGPNRCAVN